MLLTQEKLRLLSMVDVLEPLSGEELEEFSRRVPDTHVERGQVFCAPGDESEALFMLKRGKVRIYKVTPEGWEFTLTVVEAGTMFGEMALTAQRMREAYAEAAEPSDICVLKGEDLERLVRANPDVGLAMMRVLGGRLPEFLVLRGSRGGSVPFRTGFAARSDLRRRPAACGRAHRAHARLIRRRSLRRARRWCAQGGSTRLPRDRQEVEGAR